MHDNRESLRQRSNAAEADGWAYERSRGIARLDSAINIMSNCTLVTKIVAKESAAAYNLEIEQAEVQAVKAETNKTLNNVNLTYSQASPELKLASGPFTQNTDEGAISEQLVRQRVADFFESNGNSDRKDHYA
jgi:hypothetical protein